ncbi:hypothetical protein NHF46_04945 [Arthrobacter alpinus]|nr:hypothetical protein [Arthrobacter alpinus]
MKIELVLPKTVQDFGVVYRVRLWVPAPANSGPWYVDDWELTECDLDDVLKWAEERTAGNPFEIFVRAGSPDFYRLRGQPADEDPEEPIGAVSPIKGS